MVGTSKHLHFGVPCSNKRKCLDFRVEMYSLREVCMTPLKIVHNVYFYFFILSQHLKYSRVPLSPGSTSNSAIRFMCACENYEGHIFDKWFCEVSWIKCISTDSNWKKNLKLIVNLQFFLICHERLCNRGRLHDITYKYPACRGQLIYEVHDEKTATKKP